jgi:hypothetical protein
VRDISLSAETCHFLIGYEDCDERAAPRMSVRDQEANGLDHRDDGALRVTGTATIEPTVRLGQFPRVARPPVPRRHNVNMRVEGEDRPSAIGIGSNHIGSSGRKLIALHHQSQSG